MKCNQNAWLNFEELVILLSVDEIRISQLIGKLHVLFKQNATELGKLSAFN